MDQRERTAAIIDGTLRVLAGGTVMASALLMPGMLIALDKPTKMLLKKLDKRSQEREMRRILRYMKRAKLIESQKYQHGIKITDKGRRRLQKVNFNKLRIPKPAQWDQRWRLVIFDIPENYKSTRNRLTFKLKQLGFQPLQRSVWVHPFPCHTEIEALALEYRLTNYVTYVETSYIDKPELLSSRFEHLLG